MICEQAWPPGRPARELALLALHSQDELEIVGALELLAQAGIPAEAACRADPAPLVAIGSTFGPLNPEPLAAVADIVFEGFGPLVWEAGVRALHAQPPGIPRQARLEQLASVPGLYIPALYETTGRDARALLVPRPRGAAPARIHPPAASWLLAADPGSGTGAAGPLEVCAVLHDRGAEDAWRRGLEAVLSDAVPGRPVVVTGIAGASGGQAADLAWLLDAAAARRVPVRVPALPAAAITEPLAARLRAQGQERITLPLAAGSGRVRGGVGGATLDEDLHEAFEALVRARFTQITLAAWVGVPGEGTEGAPAIVALVRKLVHGAVRALGDARSLPAVALSLRSFTPRPWTQFERLPMDSVATLQAKQAQIRRAFRGDPSLHVLEDRPGWAVRANLVTRGDRRVGAVLAAVHEAHEDWESALREVNLNPAFYLERQHPEAAELPWGIVQWGPEPPFWLQPWERGGFWGKGSSGN
ncbi:MAG: hypothetical protein HYV08_08945 [Deltaproteobacteria bacterium]|nr:hypothetical protein [Deltaproteobacteria bacterium]